MGPDSAAAERREPHADTAWEDVTAWAAGREAMAARRAERVTRPDPRPRPLASLPGLLSPVARKHGWQGAEPAGDPTPAGMQRRLAT
jgi:hypothetical protein